MRRKKDERMDESVPDMRIRGQLTCPEVRQKNKKNVVDCMYICVSVLCHAFMMFTCINSEAVARWRGLSVVIHEPLEQTTC
jgi:hypothetical protein